MIENTANVMAEGHQEIKPEADPAPQLTNPPVENLGWYEQQMKSLQEQQQRLFVQQQNLLSQMASQSNMHQPTARNYEPAHGK